MEPLVDVICWLCEWLLLKSCFEEKHIFKSVCMILGSAVTTGEAQGPGNSTYG